ncbi:MAG: hypothetical protein K0R52_607 [Alphaproteobacteria bacterium]|jgi:hypothetical protein|nr:hypothetical protein [Alphaproteobacteria bacterium]
MKKFILLLTILSITTASTASAFVLTGTAAGVAGVLLPIVEPIAKDAIKGVAQEIQGVITGKKCPRVCTGMALPCKKAAGLSFCKAWCQKIRQVGGYELKIRFGGMPDRQAKSDAFASSAPQKLADRKKGMRSNPSGDKEWSLASCVRHRVRAGKNTPQGKGNLKSIAVYSQEDLNDLLSLIALQMAARQIVNTQGRGLSPEGLKLIKAKPEEVVKEAEELEKRITASITKNLADNIYGNQ